MPRGSLRALTPAGACSLWTCAVMATARGVAHRRRTIWLPVQPISFAGCARTLGACAATLAHPCQHFASFSWYQTVKSC